MGLGNGVDGVAHEIENNLLQLDAVSEDRGKRFGNVELYARIPGCRLWLCEDERVIQHGADAEGAEMRLTAAQEFTHAAHNAGGVIDLGHECRQVGTWLFPDPQTVRAKAVAPSARALGQQSWVD